MDNPIEDLLLETLSCFVEDPAHEFLLPLSFYSFFSTTSPVILSPLRTLCPSLLRVVPHSFKALDTMSLLMTLRPEIFSLRGAPEVIPDYYFSSHIPMKPHNKSCHNK